MANLIDRDSLMAQLEDRQAFLVKEWGYRDHYTRGFEEAVDKVGNTPAVDAVEVVRCKDCAKAVRHEVFPWSRRCVVEDCRVTHRETHFCSYGERKDNV